MIKQKFKLYLVGFLATIFALFFFSPATYAQSTSSLQLKPAIFEDSVRPGQEFTISIRATNLGDSAQNYRAVARDIISLTDSGTPIFQRDESEVSRYGLSDWLALPSEKITLAPGQSADVAITVKVPDDATPGGHFGAVFLGTTGSDLDGATVTGVGAQVGTILSLKVPGNVVEEAELLEFSTDKEIYGSPLVSFLARVENRGNVLLRPVGFIRITNMFGQETAQISFNDSGAAVLPEGTRIFESIWDDNKFAFGRYTVDFGMSYGSDVKRSVTAKQSFWVLPLNIIVPIVVALLSIFFIVFIGAKLYVRRQLRR